MKGVLFVIVLFINFSFLAQSNYGLDTEKFFDLEKVNDTIDFKQFNEELLAEAVFHQTNLQRKKKEQLSQNDTLQKAAIYHSKSMVEDHFFDHVNRYNKKMKTPMLRAKHFGFPSTFVGENIIEEIALDYKDNSRYHYREGKYYNDNYSKRLDVLTYKELAEKIVNRWMHSSGHRKNILMKEYKLLGVGVVLKKFETGELPTVIVTQVFGTI